MGAENPEHTATGGDARTDTAWSIFEDEAVLRLKPE
jgi:hypothetical protein